MVYQGLQHFTAPPGIPLASPGLKIISILCTPDSLAIRFHRELYYPATDALGPINAITTRGSGITAAAGTGIAHLLFAEHITLYKS